MTPEDIQRLLGAIDGKLWTVVAAILIGGLVRLAKTPIFGRVFERIPLAYRFLVPLVLGVLSGVGDALSKGTPWVPALLYGVIAGVLAIGGDKVITQNGPALVSGVRGDDVSKGP